MKIRKKLKMTLLLGSIVPLIIFAFINFYFSQTSDINNTMQNNLMRTKAVDEKINGLIDKNLAGIEVLAKNPEIREYDLDKSKQLMVEASKIYPDILSIVLTKLDGN